MDIVPSSMPFMRVLRRKYFSTGILSAASETQRRHWHPTPVLLPGKPHGQRSLVGCSAWGRWGSDTTERLPFHFSLSCIGEGNGNPLQCSCLENPRDRGAWWAVVYGVTQSRTRLKRLSSSSSFWKLVCVCLLDVNSVPPAFFLALWHIRKLSHTSIISVQLLSHVRLFATPWTDCSTPY